MPKVHKCRYASTTLASIYICFVKRRTWGRPFDSTRDSDDFQCGQCLSTRIISTRITTDSVILDPPNLCGEKIASSSTYKYGSSEKSSVVFHPTCHPLLVICHLCSSDSNTMSCAPIDEFVLVTNDMANPKPTRQLESDLDRSDVSSSTYRPLDRDWSS